jgi:Kef-type K+ transport system membrane component KefB
VIVLALVLLSALLVQAGSGSAAEISFLYRVLGAAVLLSALHWTAGRWLAPTLDAWIQVLGDLGLVTLLV